MKEWVPYALHRHLPRRPVDNGAARRGAKAVMEGGRQEGQGSTEGQARPPPRKGEEASPERKAAASVKGPRDPLLQEPREPDRKAEGGASAHRDLTAAPPQGISAEGKDKACPEAAC